MAFDIGMLVTPTALAIFGVVALLTGFGWIRITRNQDTERKLKGLGIGLLVLAVVFSGAVSFGALTNPTSTGAGPATFSVVAATNTTQPWLRFDQVNHIITVQAVYNSTSKALTNYTANVDFSITRADLSAVDTVATAATNSVASIGNQSGSGTTYPVVAKNSDGTYKVNWTRAATGAISNGAATILVPGGGSAVLTLNITMNSDAAENMKVYDTASAYFSVAGQQWTVTFLESVRNT
jgi:hypothetical protein